MNAEIFNALELLEKEKGIPVEYMLEKVEAALIGAYKKDRGGHDNVRILLDPAKKDVRVYQQREVVEQPEDPETQISLEDAKKVSKKHKIGDICETEVKFKTFRRLGAQAAKQVIIQGIREAERGLMIQEYEDKKGEIITAKVQRVDPVNGNLSVDTGTSVATLMRSEQIPGEYYRVGDMIKVYVMEVRKEATRGPVVTLSRTHPGLVKRLFELEVPEIRDGTVIIRNITREAGSRTKIAVESREENVDPVGACIGARGMRINTVVDELDGEKIDVIPYSEDAETYIKAALSPANVNTVFVDEEQKTCRVYVNADQLSLAIGKEGQNARLAARLTGYKIDIKTSNV